MDKFELIEAYDAGLNEYFYYWINNSSRRIVSDFYPTREEATEWFNGRCKLFKEKQK